MKEKADAFAGPVGHRCAGEFGVWDRPGWSNIHRRAEPHRITEGHDQSSMAGVPGGRVHASRGRVATGAPSIRPSACGCVDVVERGVPATDVAAWAGHSVEVLLKIYAKCLDGGTEQLRQRVQTALGY
jgi:hypothetical protein